MHVTLILTRYLHIIGTVRYCIVSFHAIDEAVIRKTI